MCRRRSAVESRGPPAPTWPRPAPTRSSGQRRMAWCATRAVQCLAPHSMLGLRCGNTTAPRRPCDRSRGRPTGWSRREATYSPRPRSGRSAPGRH
ncbi:EspF repeat-containing protein [Streptomyces sp. NPDC094149]|uniref:EspF repeat-containing protein n=1 Tax=Streptomyces sp. NPDC094149 TaxID=3155079 RepID=UPI00332D146F